MASLIDTKSTPNFNFLDKSSVEQEIHYYVTKLHNTNTLNEDNYMSTRINITNKEQYITLAMIEKHFKDLGISSKSYFFYLKIGRSWEKMLADKYYINKTYDEMNINNSYPYTLYNKSYIYIISEAMNTSACNSNNNLSVSNNMNYTGNLQDKMNNPFSTNDLNRKRQSSHQSECTPIHPIKLLIALNSSVKDESLITGISNAVTSCLSDFFTSLFKQKIEDNKDFNPEMLKYNSYNQIALENGEYFNKNKAITSPQSKNFIKKFAEREDSLDILFMYSNPLVEKSGDNYNFLDNRVLNIDKELQELIESIKHYKAKIKMVVADEASSLDCIMPPKIFHISCHGLIKKEGEFYLCFEREGIRADITFEILQGFLGQFNLKETSNLSQTNFSFFKGNDLNHQGSSGTFNPFSNEKIVDPVKNFSFIDTNFEEMKLTENATDITDEIPYERKLPSNRIELKQFHKLTSEKLLTGDLTAFLPPNEREISKSASHYDSKNMIKHGSSSYGNQCVTQLAVVSACHSEHIGPAFFNLGILCVVCIYSSASVMDETAIIFASSFYKYVLQGLTIQEAFVKSTEQIRTYLKEDSYKCCCDHPHKPSCKAKKNDHNIHYKYCKCTNLKYNEHRKDCRLGLLLKEKFNTVQKNPDIINTCCCSPEFPHDESNKFVLLFKDKNPDYGNIRLYQNAVYRSKDENQLVIEGPFFRNIPDFEVCYVPYLIGRCADVYKVIEYVYENENSINRLTLKRKLITFYAGRGIGKTVVCKLAARYLWERNKFQNILYLKRDRYDSLEDLKGKIIKFLGVEPNFFDDAHDLSKNKNTFNLSLEDYLIIIEVSFNTINKRNYHLIFDKLLVFSRIWIFTTTDKPFGFDFEYPVNLDELDLSYVESYFRILLKKEEFKKLKEDNRLETLMKVVNGNLWMIEKAVSLVKEKKTIEDILLKLKPLESIYTRNSEDLSSLFNMIVNDNPVMSLIIALVPHGINLKILDSITQKDLNLNELIDMKIVVKVTTQNSETIIMPLKEKDKMMKCFINILNDKDMIDQKQFLETLVALFKQYKKTLKAYIQTNLTKEPVDIHEFSFKLNYGVWRKINNQYGQTLSKPRSRNTGPKMKKEEIERIINNCNFMMSYFLNNSTTIHLLKTVEYIPFYFSDILIANLMLNNYFKEKSDIDLSEIRHFNSRLSESNNNFNYYSCFSRYIIYEFFSKRIYVKEEVIQKLEEIAKNPNAHNRLMVKCIAAEAYMLNASLLLFKAKILYKSSENKETPTEESNPKYKEEIKINIDKLKEVKKNLLEEIENYESTAVVLAIKASSGASSCNMNNCTFGLDKDTSSRSSISPISTNIQQGNTIYNHTAGFLQNSVNNWNLTNQNNQLGRVTTNSYSNLSHSGSNLNSGGISRDSYIRQGSGNENTANYQPLILNSKTSIQYKKTNNEFIILCQTKLKLECYLIETKVYYLLAQNKKLTKEEKEYKDIMVNLVELFEAFTVSKDTRNEHLVFWALSTFYDRFDVNDEETRKLSNRLLIDLKNIVDLNNAPHFIKTEIKVVQNKILEKIETFNQNIIRIFHSDPLVCIKGDSYKQAKRNVADSIRPIRENKLISFTPGTSICKHLVESCSKRVSIYQHVLTEESLKDDFTKNGRIAVLFTEDSSNTEDYWLEHSKKDLAIGSAKKFETKIIKTLKSTSNIKITYDVLIICSPNCKKIINEFKMNDNLDIKYFIYFEVDSSFLDLFEFSFAKNYNHIVLEFVKEFCLELLKFEGSESTPIVNSVIASTPDSDFRLNQANISKTTSGLEVFNDDSNMTLVPKISKLASDKTSSKSLTNIEQDPSESSVLSIFNKCKERFLGVILHFISSLPLSFGKINNSNEDSKLGFDWKKVCEPVLVPKQNHVDLKPYEDGVLVSKVPETRFKYYRDPDVEKIQSDIFFRKREIVMFIEDNIKSDASTTNFPLTNIYGVKGVGKNSFVYHSLSYLGKRVTLNNSKTFFHYINMIDMNSEASFEEVLLSLDLPSKKDLIGEGGKTSKNPRIPYDLILVLSKCDEILTKTENNQVLFNLFIHKIFFSLQSQKGLKIKIIFTSTHEYKDNNFNINYYQLQLWDDRAETRECKYSERFLLSRIKVPDNHKYSKKTYENILNDLTKFTKMKIATPKNLLDIARVNAIKILNSCFTEQKETFNDLYGKVSKSMIGEYDAIKFNSLVGRNAIAAKGDKIGNAYQQKKNTINLTISEDLKIKMNTNDLHNFKIDDVDHEIRKSGVPPMHINYNNFNQQQQLEPINEEPALQKSQSATCEVYRQKFYDNYKSEQPKQININIPDGNHINLYQAFSYVDSEFSKTNQLGDNSKIQRMPPIKSNYEILNSINTHTEKKTLKVVPEEDISTIIEYPKQDPNFFFDKRHISFSGDTLPFEKSQDLKASLQISNNFEQEPTQCTRMQLPFGNAPRLACLDSNRMNLSKISESKELADSISILSSLNPSINQTHSKNREKSDFDSEPPFTKTKTHKESENKLFDNDKLQLEPKVSHKSQEQEGKQTLKFYLDIKNPSNK